MAFGGRELRLILSIQSYGSGNFAKVRRDITALERATKSANMNQIANQDKILRNAEKMRATNVRIAASERSILGIEERIKLNKVKMAQLAKALSILEDTRGLRAQKMAATYEVIKKDNQRLLAVQKAQTGEISYQNKNLADQQLLQNRLLSTERARAEALDAAARRQNRILKFQTGARTAAHIGRTAQFTGLLGVAGLGLAANSFANFNLATAKASTQLRGVGESFAASAVAGQKLQNTIIDMTKRFPASAKDMADSAYQIASGIDIVGDSTKRLVVTQQLLRASNQVAVAGQTDLASATDTVITAFNNFKTPGTTVKDLMNTIFAIVRFGKGDFTEFSAVFGRLAGAAGAAGASLKEAGSALAFLSLHINRSQAAVGLARLFQILQRKEVIAGFKALGIPITIRVNGIERLKSLSTIVGQIVGNSPELRRGGVATSNIISGVSAIGQRALGQKGNVGLQGTQQARQALTFLIRYYKQYQDTLRNVSKDQNEFTLSLARIRSSPGFKWQLAIAQFHAFAIVVGQEVLPLLTRFLDHIVNAVHWFDNLNSHTKSLIARIATFAAIFTLVGGTILAVVSPLVGLIGTFLLMTRVLGPLKGAGLLGRLFTMAGLLDGLAAIGTIVITIKLIPIVYGKGAALGKLFNKYVTGNPLFDWSLPFTEKGIGSPSKAGQLAAAQAALAARQFPMNAAAKHASAVLSNPNLRFQKVAGGSIVATAASGRIAGTFKPGSVGYNDALAIITGGGAPGSARRKSLSQQYREIRKRLEADTLLKAIQDFMTQGTDPATSKAQKFANAIDKANASLDAAKTHLQEVKLRLRELSQEAQSTATHIAGGLFQGPMQQGPIGQVFSTISQTMLGFGQIFKVPGQFTINDVNSQVNLTKRFGRDLGLLKKRAGHKGVPQRVLDELIGQGVSALPFLEGVLQRPGLTRKFLRAERALGKASDPLEKQILAANTQYQAALLQMKAAHARVDRAEKRKHQVIVDRNAWEHTKGIH